jgi:hypothetical protein
MPLTPCVLGLAFHVIDSAMEKLNQKNTIDDSDTFAVANAALLRSNTLLLLA